jgi:trans-aconitate methyltransferase
MTGDVSHDVGIRPEWDGTLYAANTAHHRRYDGDFLVTLPVRSTDAIVDLGCGSGDFTAQLAARVPDGRVLGLDPQPSMIDEARRRALPNQSFAVAPAQELRSVAGAGEFDVVTSRAAMHWIPEAHHELVLGQCFEVLRPGGVLRIECGGGDNVREVVSFVDDVAAGFGRPPRCPWAFVGAGAALDRLLSVGFDVDGGFVRTVAQRRSFDRDAMLGWLHSQCLQAYEVDLDLEVHGAFRRAVDDRVDDLRRADGSYDLTFVRLDLLARRPG